MSNTSLPANQVSSLFQAVDIRQQIPPLIIGERSNPTGSKKFRELLLAEDFDGLLQVGMDQEAIGAHVLDLCAAWAGRNEEEDLVRLVQSYSQVIKAPLMIDSTSPKAIESALASYPGRAFINSVNLEDGGKTLRAVLQKAKKYGAAVVALTIDETGMAMTAATKLATAKRIYEIAQEEGLKAEDLLFDTLTFTVGSGDESLETAAIETLEAIKAVKREIPGAHTVLGLSNISFGLPPVARKVLNAVFLHEAVEAGLDAVIINPTNCIPLDNIEKTARNLAFDLLYNKKQEDQESPLMQFIRHFEENTETTTSSESEEEISYEQQLRKAIFTGSQAGLDDILHIMMDSYPPLEIINDHLVATMKEIGELFGSGEMLLPFVLKSAEVMRTAVDILEPYMEKNDQSTSTKILLATVQGDVHDIGKNLVNIIFSNNGYDVIDIGIKASSESIIAAAKEHKVDIICLSGLLVKSAIIMQESMSLYRDAGLTQPILLGGAALTRKFVATECVPNYPSPVIYCQDAFSGLTAIQEFEKGCLETTTWAGKDIEETDESIREIVPECEDIPTPQHMGTKTFEQDNFDFLELISKATLYRGRWKYLRGKRTQEEYQEFLRTEVDPQFETLKKKVQDENLFEPKVSYGWFPCTANENEIIIAHEGQTTRFALPRQPKSPCLSLTDYFAQHKTDVVGLFICTLGTKADALLKELYDADKYHDYFLLHGLCVSAAEALAEQTHRMMRAELNIKNGARYSFGYSACPNLELQKPLCDLLNAQDIGIKLSETFQMVPEHSVSALVVHHPAARYFSV